MASFSFTTHVADGRAIIRTRGYLSRTAGEQLEQEIVRLLGGGVPASSSICTTPT